MLRVAFVLPFGEPQEGFFPDTMLALLCAEARKAGHEASFLRAYYDGRDPEKDARVRQEVASWLDRKEADLVVVERLFDPAPVLAHLEGTTRRCVLVTRGDSFDPIEGVDLVVGASPGTTKRGNTRRTPNPGELVRSFLLLLDAMDGGADTGSVPGIARVTEEGIEPGPPPEPATLPRPFEPVIDHDVISAGEPPRIVRKTLFGNSGCPFADDPLENPHYRDIRLPVLPIARLGCAFCSMGGDYQKRPDAEVVEELVAQAKYFAERVADLEELVLNDQHSLRYLAALIRTAHAEGLRPLRWLFAARADSFVREQGRVQQAVEAAQESGHTLEVYLSGFESFCDDELRRYNKGVTTRDLLAAIDAMRDLHRSAPQSFEYARAKGHSLILWSPWTTPENLLESAECFRANGLCELFDELGRNRLRLYADLPITYAAERDGALVETWESGDEGAGRRKGYNVERPWRFLDARTRLAHELAERFRRTLGSETEVAQLRAIARFVTESPAAPPTKVEEVGTALEQLDAVFERLGSRERTNPPRGSKDRATPVHFGGGCNNGCRACPNRDTWLADEEDEVARRIDDARTGERPLLFAGREPTVHPKFGRLLQRAVGDDQRAVGIVTNGRRFAYDRFSAACLRAGLRAACIKLFAPSADLADAISMDSGGFEQAIQGAELLRRFGLNALEVRAPLHAKNLDSFHRYAELASKLGADQIRVEVALDALGVEHLRPAADILDNFAAECSRAEVPLEVSPLRAGPRYFDWLPLPRSR